MPSRSSDSSMSSASCLVRLKVFPAYVSFYRMNSVNPNPVCLAFPKMSSRRISRGADVSPFECFGPWYQSQFGGQAIIKSQAGQIFAIQRVIDVLLQII